MESPPGWYPDPQDPSRERFWDGTSWSPGSVPARRDGGNRVGYIVLAVVGGLAGLLVVAAAVFGSGSDSDSNGESSATATTIVPSRDFPLVPGTLTVVGDVTVPDGPEGEVSVVAVGPSSPGGAVVLVRNMTDAAVSDVALVGTARSPSGELLDVGDAFNTAPVIIGPGEWAFAGVSFAAGPLPADTVYDFEIRIGDPTTWGTSSTDLEVPEVAFQAGTDGGQLVGFVHNPHDWPATGTTIQGACFEGGLPTGWGGTHLGEDDVAPGAQAPFSIFVSATGCDAIVITASTRF